MSDLLRKELRLAAHPSIYIFIALGALVLVPAYPYGMVFFFAMLGVFQSIMYTRETRDIYFTALLPVRKRDAVKAKLLLAAFIQLTQLLFSVPFAFLRTLYLPSGNPVGIEANAAYYGFGLMIFGAFNLIFFPLFFKTAYKAGTAFLAALPQSGFSPWKRRCMSRDWNGWTDYLRSCWRGSSRYFWRAQQSTLAPGSGPWRRRDGGLKE